MPFWILNFKWAWQAQFLSHNLLILRNCISFEGKQMILVSFTKIHKGIKVTNFCHSCHIRVLSHPWVGRWAIAHPNIGKALLNRDFCTPSFCYQSFFVRSYLPTLLRKFPTPLTLVMLFLTSFLHADNSTTSVSRWGRNIQKRQFKIFQQEKTRLKTGL